MLNFSDVAPGDRLVIRYRLADAQAGAQFNDALGLVQEVDTETVSIQTRTQLVVVPRAAITHAKRVPPAPPRRRPRATEL